MTEAALNTPAQPLLPPLDALPTASPSHLRRLLNNALVFSVLLGAGLAYYAPVLDSWLTADEIWILNNVEPRQWWQIFTVWDVHPNNFVPGLLLSLKLDNMAFGWDFAYYRVHTVVAAALMGTLLASLLRPSCGWILSTLTALLLMVSNPTVSLVDWVASRHYIEGTCFILAGVLMLRRYERCGCIGALIGSLICYALAVLWKEVFAPLPLILLALPNVPLRRRIRLLVLFGLVGAAYIAYRRYMIGKVVGGYGDSNYDLQQVATYFVQAWPSFTGWIFEGASATPRWLSFFIVNTLIVMGLYRAWAVSWRMFAAAVLSLIAAVVPVGLVIGTPQVNFLGNASHYCMRFMFPLWIVTLIWAAFAWAALNRKFAIAAVALLCVYAGRGAASQHVAWKNDGLVTRYTDEVFRQYAWTHAIIAVDSPMQLHAALTMMLPREHPENGPVTAFVIPAMKGAISRDDPRLKDPELVFIDNPREDVPGHLAKVANVLTREEFLKRYGN